MRLHNRTQLEALRSEMHPRIERRRSQSQGQGTREVLVCSGTGCRSALGEQIVERMQEVLSSLGRDDVLVSRTGCFGFCEKGPILKVVPEGTFYVQVTPESAEDIVREHLVGGCPVEGLMMRDPQSGELYQVQEELPFYKNQVRIALRNCGLINPERIEEYIGADGYTALASVIASPPEDTVALIRDSGLRGRGGGGFPTGLKWASARQSVSDEKYVICNADEGDPGAFMDRSILEGDPHSVLEAMAIAGYCIGAAQGFIYIRAEYPLAIERLTVALGEAREFGLLGANILDSGFSFDVDIKLGAGAFVCGEEMALIHSIEGKRGEPTIKPPFPAQQGLWGKPTVVNNVETLANVPAIVVQGPRWFRRFGTEDSPGTKVFALAGKVNNVGLIEIPLGTTLRDIVEKTGGGIKNGRSFKAVQTGGPSGGCIPAQYLDTPIEYATLRELGSMMGSGGMIVMDEDNCMVDLATFYMDFTVDESCGKCTPCRIGNKRLLEILKRIRAGEGVTGDLEDLKKLSAVIKDTALCGLGQTAPNPVISTLAYFEDEYLCHVRDKRCPAGVCQSLLTFSITGSCIGCTRCARACPVGAISGKPKALHRIDRETCIKCGLCLSSCPVDAIVKG